MTPKPRARRQYVLRVAFELGMAMCNYLHFSSIYKIKRESKKTPFIIDTYVFSD